MRSTAECRTASSSRSIGAAAANLIEIAPLRHGPEARLQPEHPAAMRRDPNGSADVGPELEAGEPGCHGRRRPAGRPTRNPGCVPWVVGRAEDLVVGLEV